MEKTENEHCKFKLNALRYRQPVQFHEQWCYLPIEKVSIKKHKSIKMVTVAGVYMLRGCRCGEQGSRYLCNVLSVFVSFLQLLQWI